MGVKSGCFMSVLHY